MLGRSRASWVLLLNGLLLAGKGSGGSCAPPGADVWAELETTDPEQAARLSADLVARPELALPLLRARLRLVGVDPGGLPRLLADLDHLAPLP